MGGEVINCSQAAAPIFLDRSRKMQKPGGKNDCKKTRALSPTFPRLFDEEISPGGLT